MFLAIALAVPGALRRGGRVAVANKKGGGSAASPLASVSVSVTRGNVWWRVAVRVGGVDGTRADKWWAQQEVTKEGSDLP